MLIAARQATRSPAPLVAMAQSGSGAILSGVLNAMAIKMIAAGAGPAGVALLATLQQTRQTALVAATLNGQTSLIQGASALAGCARRLFLRTSIMLLGGATALAVTGILLFPERLSQFAGLSANHASLFRWLAPVVALSCGFVFLSALLNALGEVGRLAMLQLAAPAAMAALAWPVAHGFRRGRELPLALMLAASAATGVALAAAFLRPRRQELAGWFRGPGSWWSRDAARRFFSISGAMLISGLLSSATLVALRGRILRAQGLAATGEFDAAWTISMNHVTLVLASLQAYYLPALARTRDPDCRAAQIAGVLVPAALAASCTIAFIALLKPWVLGWFYSHEFLGAARYLRWTLLGDYLKVTSWILSIPMLAAADMRVFLAADLAAWFTFAASALALTAWKTPAESTAMAFVSMYLVHLAIAGIYSRRRHAFAPDRRMRLAWLAGLCVVLVASGIGWQSP